MSRYLIYFFFFFQAEDGIRDKLVTGVQTCALPISRAAPARDGVVGAVLGPHPRDDPRERPHGSRADSARGDGGADADGVRADRQPPGRRARATPDPPVRLPRRPEARGGDRGERGGRGVGGRGVGGVLPVARGGTPPPRAPRADPRGAPVVPGAQRAAGPPAALAPAPEGPRERPPGRLTHITARR